MDGLDITRAKADSSGTREARLRQIQMEALGSSRREHITTHDFRESIRQPVLTDIEKHRRLNQKGVKESKLSSDTKEKLNDWNTAWTTSKNDGSLQESLSDINAGQSHRARLGVDETLSSSGVKNEPVKGHQRSSIGRSRGSDRAGRGGGHVRAGLTRVGIKRIPTGGFPDHQEDNLRHSIVHVSNLINSTRPPSSLVVRAANQKVVTPSRKHQSPQPHKFQLVSPKAFLAPLPSRQELLKAKESLQPNTLSVDPEPFPISDTQTMCNMDQRPYIRDLLTIDPTESTVSQVPLEPSVHDQQRTGRDPTLSTLDARALTYFLPALKKVVSIESFQRIYDKLQAVQISNIPPTAVPNLPTNNTSSVLGNTSVRTFPGGLATAVQRDQQQWSEKIATGRFEESDCIFGEHIHQSSFGLRQVLEARRAFPGSLASSTALTEQIQRSTSKDTEPPIADSRDLSTTAAATLKSKVPTTAKKQYATRNPFHSCSLTLMSDKSSTEDLLPIGQEIFGQQIFNYRDGANLQLPDFLRSSLADEDAGAAARAQYKLESDGHEEAAHSVSSQDMHEIATSLNGAKIEETKPTDADRTIGKATAEESSEPRCKKLLSTLDSQQQPNNREASFGVRSLSTSSTRSSLAPCLPGFLKAPVPTIDHGAAVRSQYAPPTSSTEIPTAARVPSAALSSSNRCSLDPPRRGNLHSLHPSRQHVAKENLPPGAAKRGFSPALPSWLADKGHSKS